jgi:hypothetical protein
MNYLDEPRIKIEEQSDEQEEYPPSPVHQEQRERKSKRLSDSGEFSTGNK